MSTKSCESKGAKPKNLGRNQISPKDSSHENVSAETERNQLRDEVARKNDEIEKLTEAILSTREHLSKAIECLQKISTVSASASATTHGKHTDSPQTPIQDIKPPRKLGSDGVLKRSASNVTDHETSESHRPLKRSYKSAPEKSTFQEHSA